jgi:hypothetical protein
MRHLTSDYREEDVENETATEDLLERGAEGGDVVERPRAEAGRGRSIENLQPLYPAPGT